LEGETARKRYTWGSRGTVKKGFNTAQEKLGGKKPVSLYAGLTNGINGARKDRRKNI